MNRHTSSGIPPEQNHHLACLHAENREQGEHQPLQALLDEYKHTIETLRASEAHLKAILEHEPGCVKTLSPDSVVLDINPAGLRILEATRTGEVVGHNFVEAFVHPESREAVLDFHRRVLAGEEGKLQFRIIGLSGTETWVESHASPLPGTDGKGATILVLSYDITQRRLDEIQLRNLAATLEEKNRLLNASQEVACCGSWEMDLDSHKQIWSDGTFHLLGAAPEDFAPTYERFLAFVHPDDRQRVETTFIDALTHTSPRAIEFRVLQATGEVKVIESHWQVFKDPEGIPRRIVGASQDITQRKALEEQLRQSQRTELLGQLTGGVAHDFNNLLTVIRGNARRLARKSTGDEDLEEISEMLSGAAQRATELTQHLLAFARQQRLEPKGVDVGDLVTKMLSLLQHTLGEQVDVELVCKPGLWQTLVDPGQLENAFVNLCLNARDAMPSGGGLVIDVTNTNLDAVYAAQYPDVEPGEYIMVAVSDGGTGIASDQLAHVFEPFYTTKEVGKGTGLGLSMVYGFIKQSQGHITIYSEPGIGTTVKLYLPRFTGTAEIMMSEEEGLLQGGTETILLVEDDGMLRHFAKIELQALGYEVLLASNGPDALELLRQREDIDLLFTDMVMPGGMNGRELTERARLLRPTLPALLTSGYTEEQVMHLGLIEPDIQILSKPYAAEELSRRIRGALDRKPGEKV